MGLLVFPFFLFALASSAPVPAPAAREDLQVLVDYFDVNVPQWMAAFNIPGVSMVLISDGDAQWTGAYGQAQPDSVFQIASISKTVGAWGLMTLVEEGLVGLDDPAQNYVRTWTLPVRADGVSDTSGVTVRRLMGMVAGTSLGGFAGYAPEDPLPTLQQTLTGVPYAPSEPEKEGVFVYTEPGTAYSYSGGGSTFLELLMEEVTGQTFTDLLATRVLAPLGMNSSSYAWLPELQPRTLPAHNASGAVIPNYLYSARYAAGLYCTAPDLARFAMAHVVSNAGEPIGRGVLRAETVQQMWQPPIPDVHNRYALNYELSWSPEGLRYVGHSGGNTGWRSRFWINPTTREGLVFLANGDCGSPLFIQARCVWDLWQEGRMDRADSCTLPGFCAQGEQEPL